MTPEPTSTTTTVASLARDSASSAGAAATAGPGVLARLALAIVSAALLRGAFPPFHVPALALVALVPLFFALEGLAPGRAFLVGLAWGAVSSGFNTHWFVAVFDGGGAKLGAVAPLLWLLMGTFGALYGAGHALASRHGRLRLGVFGAALWISLEWLRSEAIPFRFSWFTLGHALSGSEWFRQDADLAGVYGLSLLSYGVSFLLLSAWGLRRDGRGFVLGLFAVAVPLLFWVRGSNVIGQAPPLGIIPEGRQGVRVVVVQEESFTEVPDNRKIALTRECVAAAPGPVDLVVWPEGAVGYAAFAPGPLRARLDEVARLTSGALVTGAFEAPKDGQGWWNAALLVAPSGETIGVYHKRVPVPFAEDARPGSESPVFDVATAASKNTTKVGVFICYDGTFPFVARDLVKNGAEMLVTPSMDMAGWGMIQHLEHASFYPLRACELRRPIARADSSGVSLVVDAWGRELTRIAPFDPGARSAVVVPETEMTTYVQGGWLLPYVLLALVGVGAGALGARRLRG